MKKIILFTLLSVMTYITKAQVSDRDRKFVKETIECGLYEVKLSNLALIKSPTPQVKILAKTIVDDHAKSDNELKELAEKKGIAVPSTLTDKAMKYFEKLSKKDGKDFDKAYTKCMKMDHKKAICSFKKQAKKGGDADLKQWASNTVPSLERHKEMSKEACKAVK
ncbi:MAG: outer membrane protein-like protein [Bacteroidetes bacterium]|jgi:putative membrane protein|nr:outer membrane protein-like protein [Bacteroidota bacterium]MDF2450571.1 outer membrane protein-like protein [Bacteroidota bacterium]